MNVLILRSFNSHEQVSRLDCVVQNWWLIEHLICEVCEARNSHKGEILEDTLSGSHTVNELRYFVHAMCVGVHA